MAARVGTDEGQRVLWNVQEPVGFRHQYQRPILDGAPICEIGLQRLNLRWGKCSILFLIGDIGVLPQYLRPRSLTRVLSIPSEQHGVDQSTAVAELTIPRRCGTLDRGVSQIERTFLAGVPHQELIQVPAAVDLRNAGPRSFRRYFDAEVAFELPELCRNAVELCRDRLLVLEDSIQMAAHDPLIVKDRLQHLPLRANP